MGAAAGLLDRLQELVGGSGDSLSLYLGTAVVALLVLLLLTRRGGGDDGAASSGGRIRRAMSFTSAACAEGTYVHPFIHAAIQLLDRVID